MSLKLSTGKVAFDIEFDNGDVETIYFNPHDREFVKKIMNFEESIQKKTKEIDLDKYKTTLDDGVKLDLSLENVSKIADMSEDEISSVKNKVNAIMEIDNEYQTAIKEELNNVFGFDVSAQIFKHCNPMDSVLVVDESGKEKSVMFIMQFLEGLAEELKKYQEKLSPAAQKHLNKYAK